MWTSRVDAAVMDELDDAAVRDELGRRGCRRRAGAQRSGTSWVEDASRKEFRRRSRRSPAGMAGAAAGRGWRRADDREEP